MSTIKIIKQRLTFLSPEKIEIIDESSKHIGHEGAKVVVAIFFLPLFQVIFIRNQP